MTERQFELYRLSVVENMPDSPYKRAVIEGIQHKLKTIEMEETSHENVIPAELKSRKAFKRAGSGK
jgi:hypothetical protein